MNQKSDAARFSFLISQTGLPLRQLTKTFRSPFVSGAKIDLQSVNASGENFMFRNYVMGLILASTTSFASFATGIYGVQVDSDGVTFQVPSSGCTDKSSFQFKLLETWPVQVELVNIKRD